MVGARCVSGERQRREGFGAHGGVWEARRWVSRTQFTQKHNPGPKTHKQAHRQSRRELTATTQSRVRSQRCRWESRPRKANAMTASSVSSS